MQLVPPIPWNFERGWPSISAKRIDSCSRDAFNQRALREGKMKNRLIRRIAFLLVICALLPAARAADTLQRIQQTGVLKWGADAEGGALMFSRIRSSRNI
jgi:hypothetical protein